MLHPLVNPGVRDSQRLICKAGPHIIGWFNVSKRGAVEFQLPVELTAGSDRIALTLVHPNAMRPADFHPSDDTRWLVLCFHSAGLIQTDARYRWHGRHTWTSPSALPITNGAQPTEIRVPNPDLLILIAGTLGIPPAEVSDASDMTNTRKWDSLRQVMLMTELETTYGIELTDDEMTDANSVAKIRTVLKDRGVA